MTTRPGRRIVCAALLLPNGAILCSIRHFDPIMHRALQATGWSSKDVVQGFVDQDGVFLNRGLAWPIALAAGQIIRRVGGDDGCLYSENLY